MTNEQIDELLAEIGQTPFMTKEEELMLLKAIKEKSTDCIEMKRLEKACMLFILSLIHQYYHRGLALKELFEVTKAGLRHAVESYDLDSDSKFIAYAVNQMRHSLEELVTLNSAKNE